MRLIFDVDEFLRQFVLQTTIQYAADFPDDWIKPVTEYDMAPFFQIGNGIYNYFDVERAGEIYTRAPMFPGAKEFVKRAMENHEIWIASKQKRGNEIYTIEWLGRNEIPYHSISFTPIKHGIKADMMFDDSESNLREARKAGIVAVAIDRPWNVRWDGQRAKDFNECLELINQTQGLLDLHYLK